MKKVGYFCLILSLFVLSGCVCGTQKNSKGGSEIQMLTEEYPPVTFLKAGKVTGFVTDVVREIIARQGIPDSIRLMFWDEAYKTALSKLELPRFRG
jgi:polar amino acid transport system substrate-binding protein